MLYSAIILGLVSSLHCVGMCAPLALALPYNKEQVFFQSLSYSIGRSATYAVLGLLFGFLGKGLALAGVQQAVSVLFGGVFVVLGVLSFVKKSKYNIHFTPSVSKWIRGQFGRVLRWRFAHFWLGLLNGLLPCGVVYWAIAGSLLTFDVWQGAAYMFLFGVGTMPLMLGAVLLKSVFHRRHFERFYRLIPVYQLGLGVFLMWRAFQIDPSVFYLLSPVPMCH